MKTKIVYVMCDYSQHIVTRVQTQTTTAKKVKNIRCALKRHFKACTNSLITAHWNMYDYNSSWKDSGWRARIILSYVTYYAVTKSVFFFNVSLSILLSFNPFPHHTHITHIHIEAFYVKLLSAKRQRQWNELRGEGMRKCYSNAKVALEV